ncbi:MAG: hypothetical protein CVT73_01560 [Alphaproteobacteria bacterium HGW-Alphaproteobacteria-12]|nr:MAG: hypothetical protein CVT73_01560 [Alphaproteobacteria bacterium HGW-Alphaproteobacteria-12]
MRADDAILAILDAVPSHRIEGKKRLQKLVHLASLLEPRLNVNFRIHHYGPFSAELANAADYLSLMGKIREDLSPVGIYGTFKSVYSAPEDIEINSRFKGRPLEAIKKIDAYSTVDLEVASTIAFFVSKGFDRKDALKKTKELKPTKSTPAVLKRAEQVLTVVGL